MAPTKKNPIPKVRQIKERNPKKIKFPLTDEDLFGARSMYRESFLVFALNIEV